MKKLFALSLLTTMVSVSGLIANAEEKTGMEADAKVAVETNADAEANKAATEAKPGAPTTTDAKADAEKPNGNILDLLKKNEQKEPPAVDAEKKSEGPGGKPAQ